jgi:hypothetical protein
MPDEENQVVYGSTVPFGSTRIQAAAVYCSDGRFGDQCDDFLHNALGLPRYDRLAVPGGAACLAGHFAAHREEDTLVAQLEFLISAHDLRRVVLIGHEDCAFYTTRLEMSPAGLAERQHEDLAKAAARVRQMKQDLLVDAYLAIRQGDAIAFERVQA